MSRRWCIGEQLTCVGGHLESSSLYRLIYSYKYNITCMDMGKAFRLTLRGMGSTCVFKQKAQSGLQIYSSLAVAVAFCIYSCVHYK